MAEGQEREQGLREEIRRGEERAAGVEDLLRRIREDLPEETRWDGNFLRI